MNIGKIGIWTSYRRFGIDRAGEAAKLAEQLGYGTWWVGSSPHVPDIRPVLEATSTLVAATGILNVWSNDPGETAAADAALRAEFPGRFMLGIGIGHPEATSDYRRPLTTMRAFLDGLDASPTPPPIDERCLAALGPKMLDLAGQRAAGTHTYFVPVAHTRFARERLGSGKLVAPEVACVVDTDPVRAKAVAREYAKLYLGLRNYTQNLVEFGFTDGRPRRRRLRPVDRRGHSAGQRRSRSPRSSARTSTRAPTMSACSRWARRTSRATRGRRSRRS